MKTIYRLTGQCRIIGWCISLAILLFTGGCDDSGQNSQPDFKNEDTTSSDTAGKDNSNSNWILVVHSYTADHDWVIAINRGIQMAINSRQIRVEHFYMDTKRHPEPAWAIDMAEKCLAIIDELKPNIVILADDNAQEYIGKKLAGRNDVSVAFCGVNGNPEDYGYLADNVTGVLERPFFSESLALAQRLIPTIRKVLVLSDTGKTTYGCFDYMKAQTINNVQITDWVAALTFDQWKQTVERANQEADALAIYTYHTLRSDPNSTVGIKPAEIMAWTLEHCRIPIIGFFIYSVNDGSFCGVLESGVEHGMAAGQMAMKIALFGVKPSAIPITSGSNSQSMVNMASARRLGIQLDAAVLDTVDIVTGREY